MARFHRLRFGAAWLVAALGIIMGSSPVPAQRLPAAVAAAADRANDAQALVKQHKFPEALVKFGEAQTVAVGIPQPTLRLFYQVTVQVGSATALDSMQRYDSALERADWANQTVASAQARQFPETLRAAVHHMRGVILYHLKRVGDAKAMFEQAAKEGDKTAGAWEKAIAAPAAPLTALELVKQADAAAQRSQLDEALLFYVSALQKFDGLGDQAAEIVQRTLDVALRMHPPPPIPGGTGDRLKMADTALQRGAAADLDAAREALDQAVIVVPWWSDGWKRLADVDEKLGNLAAARGALRYYLKATPKASDQSAVEQRIASLDQHISSPVPSRPGSPATPGAAPATSASFDGDWSVTQVCPPIGNTLGYASHYIAHVSDGAFHAEDGERGRPGWSEADGKIAADGGVTVKVAALTGADPSRTVRHLQPGTPMAYDVIGRIAGMIGTGKRQSARACDWSFVKQIAKPGAVADISGNWSTTDGRIIAVKQNGNLVAWSSCCHPGHEDLVVTVSGTFDGKTIAGTYHFREGQADGSGVVIYALAGDRLEGTWQTPDGRGFLTALIRHRGDSPSDLSGKWTTVSGRTVTLVQDREQVSWQTCCRQSHPNWMADVSATFDGHNVVGTYHWREGSQQGNGTVSYVLKGSQLEGTLDRPGKEPYHSLLTRQAETSVSGNWATPDGRHVEIKQNGNQVNWTTCCRPGHPNWIADVSGTVDGKNGVGLLHWREGEARGIGTVSFALNGNRIDGTVQIAGGEAAAWALIR